MASAVKEKKPFNLVKWAKSRKGQKTLICIGFTIVPLLLLFVFTYLPLERWYSLVFIK